MNNKYGDQKRQKETDSSLRQNSLRNPDENEPAQIVNAKKFLSGKKKDWS